MKSKHSLKCPNCGGDNILNFPGKWLVCHACKHRFKVGQGLHRDKDLAKRRDKAIDSQKRYHTRKWLKRRTAQLRNSPTVAESEFAKRLAKEKIFFVDQWAYNVEGFMGICDFLLPNHNIIIEVDGGYHLEEEQQLKDAEKDFICEKLLKKKVLRLTNKQATSLSMDKILELIENCKKGLRKPQQKRVIPEVHRVKRPDVRPVNGHCNNRLCCD